MGFSYKYRSGHVRLFIIPFCKGFQSHLPKWNGMFSKSDFVLMIWDVNSLANLHYLILHTFQNTHVWHPHKLLWCIFAFFWHKCTSILLLDTELTTVGSTNQRSRFLALMCQHDRGPEIQTDSLSLYPLPYSQLLLDTLPIFLLIKSCFLFCLACTNHLGATWLPKEN